MTDTLSPPTCLQPYSLPPPPCWQDTQQVIKHYLVVLSLLSSLPASCCSNSSEREVQCVHSLLAQHSCNTHNTHQTPNPPSAVAGLASCGLHQVCQGVIMSHSHCYCCWFTALLISFPCAQSIHADTHVSVHCYSIHYTKDVQLAITAPSWLGVVLATLYSSLWMLQ